LCSGSTCFEQVHPTSPHGKSGGSSGEETHGLDPHGGKCSPRRRRDRRTPRVFALQAGREIRILVESEQISDEETVWLSKDIARRIENELEYPGQIKVTVIRETRAVDYAR
jgi:hypothetical protein